MSPAFLWLTYGRIPSGAWVELFVGAVMYGLPLTLWSMGNVLRIDEGLPPINAGGTPHSDGHEIGADTGAAE